MALEDAADVRCFTEQMAAAYDASGRRLPQRRAGRGDPRPFLRIHLELPLRGPRPEELLLHGQVRVAARLPRRRDPVRRALRLPVRRRAACPPVEGRRRRLLGRLKRLVERASRINGGRPVTIVAHSYCGTLAHRFLLRRPLPWRKRFVRRFVPVTAPWGGVVLGMLTLVAGNNLGLPFIDPVTLRAIGDHTEQECRTYMAHDAADFLDDIGPYESRVLPLFRELPSPRVPVACVVGVGVDTPEMLAYTRETTSTPEDAQGAQRVTHGRVFVDDTALAVIISAILRPN
ncbi:hypothetical protein BDA96_01G303600 [Sorghum bicolor]|uniref:Uncharacterized protein n=1 Tax=Sorghum bicolor TaxID=4558 RepID=A0A921V1V6_SORBI|nr:hypothetical protein BDA96_01G303600 [Sorghum bicolor]